LVNDAVIRIDARVEVATEEAEHVAGIGGALTDRVPALPPMRGITGGFISAETHVLWSISRVRAAATRPAGVAVVEVRHAETARLATDRRIIEAASGLILPAACPPVSTAIVGRSIAALPVGRPAADLVRGDAAGATQAFIRSGARRAGAALALTIGAPVGNRTVGDATIVTESAIDKI